jgi:hypothetical protein
VPASVVDTSIAALATEESADVLRELIRLLGFASEHGSAQATAALSALFVAEMAKEPKDFTLLELLGGYVSAKGLAK